jgi:hypothetical protein
MTCNTLFGSLHSLQAPSVSNKHLPKRKSVTLKRRLHGFKQVHPRSKRAPAHEPAKHGRSVSPQFLVLLWVSPWKRSSRKHKTKQKHGKCAYVITKVPYYSTCCLLSDGVPDEGLMFSTRGPSWKFFLF